MELLIKRFLSKSSGDGYGYGYGYGSGYGYGYGDGYGSGDGSGLITFAGRRVYYIDGFPTLINKIHGNLAKGFIITKELILKPCYIAKGNDLFAHGATFKEAYDALQEKVLANLDPEERIDRFIQQFSTDKKYPAQDFFKWHNVLTGSCEFGRKEFVRQNNIDMTAKYSVREFIDITRDAFGGEIITQLEERLFD